MTIGTYDEGAGEWPSISFAERSPEHFDAEVIFAHLDAVDDVGFDACTSGGIYIIGGERVEELQEMVRNLREDYYSVTGYVLDDTWNESDPRFPAYVHTCSWGTADRIVTSDGQHIDVERRVSESTPVSSSSRRHDDDVGESLDPDAEPLSEYIDRNDYEQVV